ncbi:hypothetical protein ANO11243_092740 [Dothideomycetidae sp. 11243]|nr:hypothetical protein ANO11243_092740 [fungal sp. No.11243]
MFARLPAKHNYQGSTRHLSEELVAYIYKNFNGWRVAASDKKFTVANDLENSQMIVSDDIRSTKIASTVEEIELIIFQGLDRDKTKAAQAKPKQEEEEARLGRWIKEFIGAPNIDDGYNGRLSH